MSSSMQGLELPKRYIGKYTGETKGPLFICLGGLHGNETAGVEAMELMFKMLEVEPITNPDFSFTGRFVGLRGNTRALALNTRYLEKDMNRIWTDEYIHQILNTPKSILQAEDLETRELLETIHFEIEDYQPEKFVLLDLHTTTAFGGIFGIPSNDPESVRIALELHAPVIKGMTNGLKGTTLHYFTNDRFEPETVAVTFESGQHEEYLSVNRAIAAITNCMRTIGCVKADDVENRHDELLVEYSKGLPKLAELIKIHTITPADEFRMMPDYKNFQTVKKGELLAFDRNGEILAPEDSLILMPLYQDKGDDGFFLIRPVN